MAGQCGPQEAMRCWISIWQYLRDWNTIAWVILCNSSTHSYSRSKESIKCTCLGNFPSVCGWTNQNHVQTSAQSAHLVPRRQNAHRRWSRKWRDADAPPSAFHTPSRSYGGINSIPSSFADPDPHSGRKWFAIFIGACRSLSILGAHQECDTLRRQNITQHMQWLSDGAQAGVLLYFFWPLMIHDCSLQLKACEIGPNFLMIHVRNSKGSACWSLACKLNMS